MTTDRPARDLDTDFETGVKVDIKRILFVGAAMWGLFHVFGTAAAMLAGYWPLLGALLFIDALGALAAGLFWLARRIFPDKE